MKQSVITSYSIHYTKLYDAEGRLTLADAITYTLEKEGVEKIVDVATLTGAALVGLGTTTTAVVTNSDKDYRKLEKASVAADERVWRLPNFPEYRNNFV